MTGQLPPALEQLRELAERCRVNEAAVVLDPIVVRELVEAAGAAVELAELVDVAHEHLAYLEGEACEAPADDDAAAEARARRILQLVHELELPAEVTRARWCRPRTFPSPSLPFELVRERDELDVELERLDAVSPRLARVWRRIVGRRTA